MKISLFLCWTLIFLIHPSGTLRCYFCREQKQCGSSFLSETIDRKIVYGNDRYDVCSITLNSDQLIDRDIVPSHLCRSSAFQFCCNEDLCNGLPSPPLPALTSLSCAILQCQNQTKQCSNSNYSIIYRSSATESCFISNGSTPGKLYQRGCSSNNGTRCCFSSLCNQNILHAIPSLRCYTCDSRVTGLQGCSLLDTASPHVFESVTWNPSESCAMITGLSSRDIRTGTVYPTFTIRTFIDQCVNQSLGMISYAGASFFGRIECCSSPLCNMKPLSTNLTLSRRASMTLAANHSSPFGKAVVFTVITCLGVVFIFIGIFVSIYRWYLEKSNLPNVFSDGATVTFLPAG